jgi:hypothetical protein
MRNQYFIVNNRQYGISTDGAGQYFDRITSNYLPGDDVIYAISQNGTVLTSEDGNIWTTRTYSTTGAASLFAKMTHSRSLNLMNMVVNNSYFTSGNGGITWQQQTTPFTFNSITWSTSLGLYVAVGTNNIATSTNGLTWTVRNTASYTWRDVEWNSTVGRFLAISSNGARATYSSNGTSWTNYDSTSATNFNGSSVGTRIRVILGNFIFVGSTYRTSSTGLSGSWSSIFTTNNIGTIRDVAHRPQFQTTPAYYIGVLSNSSTNQNIWVNPVGGTFTRLASSVAYYGAIAGWGPGGPIQQGAYIAGHNSILRRELDLSFTTITIPNATYLHLYVVRQFQ